MFANQFDLTDAHPAPPQRDEPSYVTRPPTAPHTVPLAEDCTPEQILDLAAAASRCPDTLWSLLGSSDHVAAICQLLSERIEPAMRLADKEVEELEIKHAHAIRTLQQQLATAQAIGATLQMRLDDTRRELSAACRANDGLREENATQTELVIAHLREALRLQKLLAIMSNEVAVTRHAMAAMAESRHSVVGQERARARVADGSDPKIVIDVPVEGAAL